MSDLTAVLVALALLAANAFFVASEFALVSARRSQIEPRATAGSRLARTTLRAQENVSQVMAAAQLGITLSSLGLGAVGEPAVAHLIEPALEATGVPDGLLHPIAFVIAMSIVVYLHVVLGEMVPKNIALAGPDRAALVLAPPMVVVVTALKPVVAGLNAVANGVLRLVRVEPRDDVASAYTRDEVAAMVDESRQEGMLEHQEYVRLSSALGFTDRTVESVLLPRDETATVARHASLADIEQVCAQTGFSRFPVTGEGSDLVGYLHIKDVLTTDPEHRSTTLDGKYIRPFATVRPGDLLSDALTTLRRRNAHMGRVVEDDGTVVGVVMLEDVLEELIGEVRDAVNSESG